MLNSDNPKSQSAPFLVISQIIQNPIHLGIGGTQRLARALGKSKAMELVLTGGQLDAKSAEIAGKEFSLNFLLKTRSRKPCRS
jgi:hypothetical protein